MTTTKNPSLDSSTYTADDPKKLDQFYTALHPSEATNPRERFYLVGSIKEEPVELPEEAYDALLRVVDAMRHGHSVTVAPTDQTLTTQQAADFLGISRPTLIKALDARELSYTRPGKHRRLTLSDVLDYREQRRLRQYEALDAIAANNDDETDIKQTLHDLRSARKAIAIKRKGQRDA